MYSLEDDKDVPESCTELERGVLELQCVFLIIEVVGLGLEVGSSLIVFLPIRPRL
jgi:hypothetical protein